MNSLSLEDSALKDAFLNAEGTEVVTRKNIDSWWGRFQAGLDKQEKGTRLICRNGDLEMSCIVVLGETHEDVLDLLIRDRRGSFISTGQVVTDLVDLRYRLRIMEKQRQTS